MKASFVPCLGAAVLLTASIASAQTVPPTVTCASQPNPVYVAGSTALRSFIGIVGKLLASDPTPTTVVYQSQGSCTGVQRIYDPDLSRRTIRDIPAVGSTPANYAVFYKADGSLQECSLETPNGTEINLGISDVFAKSCGYNDSPVGVSITDYLGPVQPMVFVVPAGSKQTSISYEAAYLAFGLGGSGKAAPWVDPRYFFIRNATSGTQQMISAAIGVPGGKWWGVNRGGSSAVRDQLKIVVDTNQADSAIGILSTDVADADRANLRALAYRAKGQTCAYLPDASANSLDKQNVRDGHYDIWGASHIFARTVNGTPISASAQAFLARFVTPRLPQELIEAIIAGSLVPQCAMQVTRTEEVGPMSSAVPPYSCGCFFDKTTRGSTTCKACKDNSECGGNTPVCNYGFCENK